MVSSLLGLLLSPMRAARPLDRPVWHHDPDRIPRRASADRNVAGHFALGDRSILSLDLQRLTRLRDRKRWGLTLCGLRAASIGAREIWRVALCVGLAGRHERSRRCDDGDRY